MTADLRLVDRLRWTTGAVLLVALAFSQAPGRVVADTKLDLVVDPGRFLRRAMHAWDPQAAFGQLQNQAYGYLFPMGPFFWVTHELGIPAWAAQRLWWATLLLAAYAGFSRLARLLGLGTPDTRVLAGLAYALGPRVITELGSISVEALPLMVLPWIVIPLVSGSRGGSPRRAAALSGVAVLCLGGVNAAASAAVLVVPALYLLSRPPGSRRRRLMAWWVLAVALATAWWVVPLLVLGRYAYPFLSYIETARLTTSVASATNVLRGTDHWVAFLVGPLGAQWPAGHTLATVALPAAATVLVAGLGLAGIARRSTPDRRFLGWCVLAGAVLVGAGYGGAAGGVSSGVVRGLLDGSLAPLRNVHKFDPVLRLPLTLGLAVTLSRIPVVARRLAARMRGVDGQWLRAHPHVAPATLLSVALVPLLVVTAPAWTGGLAARGTFTAVPAYWGQAADWLAARDGAGRALLEPASRFGDYRWGRPADEPLQALARSPWAVLDAVPLGAPGATRLMNGFETQLDSGVGSPDLATAMTRAGIRYVVLRSDLAPDAAATPPAVVRAALVGSPGFTLAATFGPPTSTAGRLLGVVGSLPRRPAVEIFAVGDGAVLDARLLTAPTVGLSGGPEALSGGVALDPSTPYVALADGASTDRTLVTDTLRLRRRDMGVDAVDAYGPTQPAGTDTARGQPVGDVLPYGGDAHQTTSRLVGATSVTATSSAADPFAQRYLGAAYDPFAAVDGDVGTAWVADEAATSPSWRVDLGRTVALTRLTLDFSGLPGGVSAPTEVTVRTAYGRWTGPASGDRVAVGLPAGRTSWLEVQLLDPAGGAATQLGLAEVVGLPPISRTAVVPPDSSAAGRGSTWAFVREPGARRSCVATVGGWACVPSASGGQALQSTGPEPGALDRTFSVGASVNGTLAVTVTPHQGPALDRLLDSADGVSVIGSSVVVNDSAARPGAAVDADPTTAWIPAASDASPQLGLTYPSAHEVSGLRLLAPTATFSRVAQVVISSAGQTRSVTPGLSGTASFPALDGRQFTITFRLRPAAREGSVPAFAEVQLIGAPTDSSGTLVVPCGEGPVVQIDNARLATSMTASAHDVLSGAPLPVQVCGTDDQPLRSGTHHLLAPSTPSLDVNAVTIATSPPAQGSDSTEPTVSVQRWTPEKRVVGLPPGGGTLVLDEGFNAGWTATVSGHRLEPVRVDGWRQGWVVPADISGTAVLRFGPGRLQRAGLLGGLAAVLLLLALLVPPSRRPTLQASRPVRVGWLGRNALPLAVAVVLAGLGGVLGWAVGRLVGGWSAVRGVVVGSVALAVLVAADLLVAPPAWWRLAAAQVITVALLVAATSGGERRGSSAPQAASRRARRLRGFRPR